MNLYNNRISVTAIIKHIQDGMAIVKTNWGELSWPTDKLPKDIENQKQIVFEISTNNRLSNDQIQERRRLLTELAN